MQIVDKQDARFIPTQQADAQAAQGLKEASLGARTFGEGRGQRMLDAGSKTGQQAGCFGQDLSRQLLQPGGKVRLFEGLLKSLQKWSVGQSLFAFVAAGLDDRAAGPPDESQEFLRQASLPDPGFALQTNKQTLGGGLNAGLPSGRRFPSPADQGWSRNSHKGMASSVGPKVISHLANGTPLCGLSSLQPTAENFLVQAGLFYPEGDTPSS